MSTSKTLRHIVALAAIAFCLVSTAAGVDVVEGESQGACTCTIRVTDAGGNPISGLAVRVVQPGDDPLESVKRPHAGVTDVGGVATVQLRLADECREVGVQFIGGLGADGSREQNRALFTQWAQVTKSYVVSDVYRQAVTAGQTEVDVAIVLQPGISVTGRVVGNGKPVANAAVHILNRPLAAGATYVRTAADGSFVLAQGSQNEAFWMSILSYPYKTVVRVEPHAGANVIELGEVQIGPIDSTCETTSIQLTNIAAVGASGLDQVIGSSHANGLTFVRDDGAAVLAFESPKDHKGYLGLAGHRETKTICMPAGRYYVLPGWGNNEQEIWKIVSLAKAQPKGAALPMMTLEVKPAAGAGAAAEVHVVDAAEAEAGMRKAIGDVP